MGEKETEKENERDMALTVRRPQKEQQNSGKEEITVQLHCLLSRAEPHIRIRICRAFGVLLRRLDAIALAAFSFPFLCFLC